MHCQRCGSRMSFEKFYGQYNSFFGWHCVMWGDILDPVILLHRLSQDANVSIPERRVYECKVDEPEEFDRQLRTYRVVEQRAT